ncbi:MAG: zinc ABC transporter substrate-binding protein [Verrucomicrobiales bacterium]|nr:zinc ABC transporter substrate-binding protein [Verrucomicrobiales bacterium]
MRFSFLRDALVLPVAAIAAMLALCACHRDGDARQGGGANERNGRPVVVTTTTMVTDLVRSIAGDAFEIESLMGPGVDPHLYKPTAEDIKKLQRARLIVYSGLHLEGRMTDTFEKLAHQGRSVVSLGGSLPKDQLLTGSAQDVDPHIWGDASLWSQTVPASARALGEIAPERRGEIDQRAREYQERLAETHRWLQAKVQELPPAARVLITSHDAFRYFGRAYGLTVHGIQGISTDSEASGNDMARMIDIVKSSGLKAVFVESSVPPTTINRISRDTGAKVGGELLSDALSTPGDFVEVGDGIRADRGTVPGMLKANMATIVNALK